MNNLAFKLPDAAKMMEETLKTFKATEVPRGNKPVDPRYSFVIELQKSKEHLNQRSGVLHGIGAAIRQLRQPRWLVQIYD
jgi:hypothetical protein